MSVRSLEQNLHMAKWLNISLSVTETELKCHVAHAP